MDPDPAKVLDEEEEEFSSPTVFFQVVDSVHQNTLLSPHLDHSLHFDCSPTSSIWKANE